MHHAHGALGQMPHVALCVTAQSGCCTHDWVLANETMLHCSCATVVPTVLPLDLQNKRLVEEECAKEDLVRMLFEED